MWVIFYLEVVVGFLGHSEVVGGFHEVKAGESVAFVVAGESDVNVGSASGVVEDTSGGIERLFPEDNDIDGVGSDTVEVGEGIFVDDEFTTKEDSPWVVAVEIKGASRVDSSLFELDLKIDG